MHGFVTNVDFLLSKGIDVNQKTGFPPKPPYIDLQEPVVKSKIAFWSSTLLHVASQGGHKKLVDFLLHRNISLLERNSVNLTAFHLAAEHSHLTVVERLYKEGILGDQLALHHAAINGHVKVVQFLLQSGVTDNCVPCDGSLHWAYGMRRYQSSAMSNEMDGPLSKIKQFLTHGGVCPYDKNDTKLVFVDDKHLIFSETALQAAVSRQHFDVVQDLLSYSKAAVSCQDYSGRTPLPRAAKRNSIKMAKELIAAGATVHARCKNIEKEPITNLSRISFCTLSLKEGLEYFEEACPCGTTALHVAT